MFNIMGKEKQRLEQTKRNLVVSQDYYDMCLKQAQDQSKAFMSSPAGIGSAFAAGALKGATADVPTPPASMLFNLASRFL